MYMVFNRISIIVYSLYRYIRREILKDKKIRKEIVIYFPQQLGDALLFSDALDLIGDICLQKKYKVFFLANKNVIKFLNEVVVLNENIVFKEIDSIRLLRDFSYYRMLIREYFVNPEIMLIPHESISSELVAMASGADKRIALVSPINRFIDIFTYIIYKMAYTESIYPALNSMVLQRYKYMIKNVFGDNMTARLPVLRKGEEISEKAYCVICPGASLPEKKWSVDNYIEVIKYILKVTDWDICICGADDDRYIGQKIIDSIKDNKRIKNHCGMLGYYQWSSLIQGAQFLIGNDSASVHIAAAARIPSVCICGPYDKFEFLPYQIDEKESNLPIVLQKEMKCEFCRTKGISAGYGNRQCKKNIKAGRSADCISRITAFEVIDKIDLLFNGDDIKERG